MVKGQRCSSSSSGSSSLLSSNEETHTCTKKLFTLTVYLHFNLIYFLTQSSLMPLYIYSL